MGKRESYEPGTFSFAELSTNDAGAAKTFYSELFGWDFDDSEVGEGMTYSMAKVDGATVGALFESDQTPPHWNSYITVKSADDTARHVADTGGEVISEAFDVMEAGRMAVLADPQGAVFSVWEAKESIGAELVNVPGSLTWNDLMTKDLQGAIRFYSDLFGWEVAAVDPDGRPEPEPEPEDDEPQDADERDDDAGEDEEADEPPAPDRVSIRNGDALNGGMATLPEGMDDAPAHWVVYFAVADAEATARQADEHGGTVIIEPMDVPAGKLALLQDPQGAMFGVVSGDQFDD